MAVDETAQIRALEAVSDGAQDTVTAQREHLLPWVKPYYAEPRVISVGSSLNLTHHDVPAIRAERRSPTMGKPTAPSNSSAR